MLPKKQRECHLSVGHGRSLLTLWHELVLFKTDFFNLLLNNNETPLVLFELKGNRVFIDYDVMFGCVSIVELRNLHLHEYLLCLCMSTLHLFGSLGYESFLVVILFL